MRLSIEGHMSLRDRIDPMRAMSYVFAVVFIATIAWLFIQELGVTR